jgi:macrolide-specific efflux system membrane fusion protein
MADHLIVKAQVDETDLAKIHLGQKTSIILDAYQNMPVEGVVEHIAYESETINNVTIYKVDILPKGSISRFRSGMSATVNFLLNEKQNALLLPVTAVKKVRGKALIFVKDKADPGYKTLEITTGVESTDKIEITSGLSDEAEVMIPTAKMALDAASGGRRQSPMNPFGGNRNRTR